MRRGSSTVVALVGEIRESLLAELARSPNLSLVRPPEGPGLEAAAAALREASARQSPYAVVPADPLAEVGERWRALWGLAGESREFEEMAGMALAAWRAGRFELPDYYLVVAAEPEPPQGPGPHPQDLYLAVLRSVRPSRVAAVPGAEGREGALRVLEALRHLGQGPWWPPLDQVIEEARRFFIGRLGEGPEERAALVG